MIAINVSMIGTFTIAITEKQTLKKAGLLYPFMIYEANIIISTQNGKINEFVTA